MSEEEKEARTSRADKRVPKLDSYFTVINKETDFQESETQQPQEPEPTPFSFTTLETSNLNVVNITTRKNVTEPESRVEIAKYTKLNDVGLWDVFTENGILYWIERFLRVSICKRPI
jgi:ribosomal protein L33